MVINGKVQGLWKRTVKKDLVLIEIQLFSKQSKSVKSKIEMAAALFGDFINKKTELQFVQK